MRRLVPIVLMAAALAACGGSGRAEPRLGTGPPPRQRAAPLVAALGDSITAGSPLWDPDPNVRLQIGSRLDARSQYELWARRRMPGVRIRNCGVFGERTDQIARRLPACVRGARALIVQGGINDIAQGRPVAAAARDLGAMVRAGRERGLRVTLVEVLPWNNGYPAADLQIRALNRLIRRLGREQRVAVLPWYRRLEDPRAPGRMRSDLTIDGSHPSIRGYRILARDLPAPPP